MRAKEDLSGNPPRYHQQRQITTAGRAADRRWGGEGKERREGKEKKKEIIKTDRDAVSAKNEN